jgi:hypothetical protein
MRRMRRVLVCVAAIAVWGCSGPDEPSRTTPSGDRGDGDEEAGSGTTVEAVTGADEPAADPLEVVEHDDACEPQDARGEGECDAIVGTFWQGRCVQLSGCQCSGEDCDDALGSMRECEELYAHCP